MKHIISIAVFGMLMGYLFISCDPPTEAETTGSVEGIIYDASTSQPLAGVTITTEPITSSKITDTNGGFKINGVEPGEYALQATKTGYVTNTTTINIVAGETSSADMQLTVVTPELSVSVTSLHFGSTSTSLPFTITNTGEGTLEWSAIENADWLSINPASGSLGSDQASVAVQVDRSGLSPGDFSESITISSNGGSAVILVNMVLDGPVLSVSATNLEFGTASNSQSFTISNTGMGSLDWTLSSNASWLTLSPSTGSVTSSPSAITVLLDRASMTPGIYSEIITVSTNGGSAVITLSATILGPELTVSNNSLNFGSSSTSLTFNVINSGIETLTYNMIYTANWLSVNPTSGSATSETDVMTVTVDRAGLAYGNYFETITVASNANSATIDVMMIVADPSNPQLSAYPSTIDFGTNSTEETFNITNSGSGMLTWNITDDKSWISVNPQSGITESETDEITVTIDRLGQSPGTYPGVITISSDGGNQNISVSMTIPDEPSLSIAPSSLDFGSTETGMPFNVVNAGSGDLEWSVSDNQEWIITSPSSGTNYATVNVNISRDGMTAGDYSGTVTISSNGGTGYVEVFVNMPADDPPADIELLSPSSITENSMTLNWTRNFDSDFAAYKVYRDLTPAVTQGSELLTTIINSTDNHYTDTGLQASTTYYYRVYAMDTANQYTSSNIVSATTQSQLGSWSVNANIDGIDFRDVDALSEDFAYAVGTDGSLYFYNGTEWVEDTHPATGTLYKIEIISQTDMWTYGYSQDVYHYDGISWSISANFSTYSDFEVVSSTDIYIGGYGGQIHHYDGSEWTTITVDAYNIVGIQMESAESGWAIDAYGKIFYYNGFGWSLQQLEAPSVVSNFIVFNSSDIWTTSSNTIYHWNGVDWTEFGLPSSYRIYDYFQFSSNSIWFVGGNNDGSFGSIIRYWDSVELLTITNPTDRVLAGITMMSETDGWAVGYNGVILRYH